VSKTRQSWGRYPAYPQQAEGIQWRDQIQDCLDTFHPGLPFGQGRSYGDVCLASNDRVLEMSGLRRVIQFDRNTGIIRAEAGISLNDLLAITVPAGWFLPVVPGTGLATLGGAIANDVHGKNHHRNGTFGCHILRLCLFRQGAILECSPTLNAELFQATIAGLGLTGFILWAEIRLQAVNTAHMDGITERFDRLQRFFELADQYDDSHEYGVAWIDCLASGSQQGRGVYFAANHARYAESDKWQKRPLNMPLTPPFSLVNPWSLQAFNQLYWHTKPARPSISRQAYPPFFFPLDSIGHWNRMYGPRGFQQYQCVIPGASEQPAIAELLSQIGRSRQGSFLAVLKRCGTSQSPGLLSFPMPGTSLALDFPNPHRLEPLLQRLDQIVREAGGRLYPAKDAHMSADDFRRDYPAWQQVEQWRAHDIQSRFWARVTQ
jgi:FAD/FMN-containing dehydrogenase